MKKRIITLILTAVLLAALLPQFTLDAAAAETSGICGENLTWSFDEATGAFTITGSGEMSDWTSKNPDWYSFARSIRSVSFPNGLLSIGCRAFVGCRNLTSIIIPDGVRSIGNGAFYGCSLITVDIPNSTTSIGPQAFACTSLTAINVASDNPAFSSLDGVLFNKDQTVLHTCPGAITGAYQIPDTVTTIDTAAFNRCEKLQNVTIPESVTSIGVNAFLGCISLSDVTIPNSVTSLASQAFSDCTSLTSVFIPASVKSVSGQTFNACSSLAEILVDEENEYFSCDDQGVLFDKNKTTLIGYPCGKTESNYSIPEGVEEIGLYAFLGNRHILRVTIPFTVAVIGNDAFYSCSNLMDISIPPSVTRIGAQAFYNCSSLTSVTIPESVTNIGYSAFRECKNLTSLVILSNQCEIQQSDPNNNYSGRLAVPGTTTICGNAGSTAEAYAAEFGYTFEPLITGECGEKLVWTFSPVAGELLISGTGQMDDWESSGQALDRPWKAFEKEITSVVLEDGVTSIGAYAFDGCSDLADVTIPNSVTSIGNDAFWACVGLTELTIPDSVTVIGAAAFYSCKNLTDVTIPDSVTSLGAFAFQNCSGLSSVVISNSVTSIGEGTFAMCSSLESVTVPVSVTIIGSAAFAMCTVLVSITILNDRCEISGNNGTLGVPGTATIYGEPGSTAEAYAQEKGYAFEARNVPVEGACGERLTWRFDADAGRLNAA